MSRNRFTSRAARLLAFAITMALSITLGVPASPAAATYDDIPHGPQDPAAGIWFTTPGGISYTSPGIGGHVETGRISVFIADNGLAASKGVRIVLVDAVYGMQEVRLKPTGDGADAVPFCGVPEIYRSGYGTPPGYQPQTMIAYYPDADGTEYALRYDVDWRIAGFSLQSTESFVAEALHPGQIEIKTLTKQFKVAKKALHRLKYQRKLAQRRGDVVKVRVLTRQIKKVTKPIKLKRQVRRLNANQQLIALNHQACSGGPYTAP